MLSALRPALCKVFKCVVWGGGGEWDSGSGGVFSKSSAVIHDTHSA